MVAGGYDKGLSEGCVVMLIHSILSILAPKAPHQTHTFHPIHDETEEEGNRQHYMMVSVFITEASPSPFPLPPRPRFRCLLSWIAKTGIGLCTF